MKRKCWHEYPVNVNGDMSAYPSVYDQMAPAEPFDAELTFDRFARGRSSAVALFDLCTGVSAPMFLSNLQEIIHILKDGKIRGRWIVVKKGENYGIAIEELPEVH